MENLCKNNFFCFQIFSFSNINHDFIIYTYFTRIAYTYNILVLILYSKMMTNLASVTVFNTIYNDDC